MEKYAKAYASLKATICSQSRYTSTGKIVSDYDEGYKDGSESVISKLTELTVTENGEYLPEKGSVGFSKVSVALSGDGNTYWDGLADGKEQGYAQALAKRTDLVVGENGEYTPSEDSTGFKRVVVDVIAHGGAGSIDELIERKLTEISSGAKSIAEYVFYENKSITSVNFPNATNIGESAFSKCSNLNTANIPNAATFGTSAFYSCSKLTSANFPNATRIEATAFQYCFALASADISSATNIGASAFSSCYVLKAVVLRSESICTLANTSAFANCHHILGTVDKTYNPNGDKDGYFYVPKALVESYKVETNWSTYSTQFRALEDYTVDGTITGALDESKI
jgi:hypothetical protein